MIKEDSLGIGTKGCRGGAHLFQESPSPYYNYVVEGTFCGCGKYKWLNDGVVKTEEKKDEN